MSLVHLIIGVHYCAVVCTYFLHWLFFIFMHIIHFTHNTHSSHYNDLLRYIYVILSNHFILFVRLTYVAR